MTNGINRWAQTKGKPIAMVPMWSSCAMCSDAFCNYHGEHVADCSCPSVDLFVEYLDLAPDKIYIPIFNYTALANIPGWSDG